MTAAAQRVTEQEALREAVTALGSQAALARLVGVSQPSVFKWLRKGQKLPPEHVLAVEAATGVSRHNLRPDIYPRSEVPVGSSTDSLLEAAR